MRTRSSSISFLDFLAQKFEDYKLLTKFRLSGMVVFSAFVAYVFASEGQLDWKYAILLLIGGYGVTGAANALNQVLEKDFDALMTRTENRPLPAGRMTTQEAILVAGIMSAGGIMIFAIFFNAIAALISTVSLLSYAFIYTPMKRVSPVAVWIGAIPGALPIAIGWVSATGVWNLECWILFSFQFLWQFPHFFAIGWVAFDDYTRAGYKLLPSAEGKDRQTATQCIFYAMFLIPLPLLAVANEMISMFSAGVLVLAGFAFTMAAVRLFKTCTDKDARRLMFASFFYLPIVYIVFLIESFI